NVILFISGDDGWGNGVARMAEGLTSEHNALVAGVDIIAYLRAIDKTKEDCTFPPGHFEKLSKYIQLREGLKSYIHPTIIGYSSGATMAYTVLAQAPPDTFAGGMSLGFCPDLWTNKPFCKGFGLE